MKRITSVMLAVLLVVVALLSVGCQQDEPQKFKVTFETFDGKSTVVEVVEEQKVQMPEEPTSEFATFLGWYADDTLETTWDFNAPIVGDTTIYASWKYKHNVTITFKPQNGEANIKVSAHTGFYYEIPQNPIREHWSFSGWYTDTDCKYQFDTTKPLNKYSNFVLYAGWTLNEDHVHDFKYSNTVEPDCDDYGFDIYVCECGTEQENNIVKPLGHTLDAGDDYLRFYECSVCKKMARKESIRTYDDVFKYEFSQEKADEIDLLYQQVLDILSNAERYSSDYARTWDDVNKVYDTTKDVAGLYDENKQFEEKYDEYYEKLMYVTEQYQYAYVFYCVHDGDAAYEEAYEFVTDYRTDMVKNFYSLYRLVYETKYREFFFAFDEGWTDEDIQDALVLSDSYGGDEYTEYNKIAEDLQIEFRELSDDEVQSGNRVPEMYKDFVDANNSIAKLAGYDNYMDYAYDNVYGRDYKPEDVANMRNYVKSNIAPYFEKLLDKYLYGPSMNSEQKKYANALSTDSMFKSPLTAEIIADYLSVLYSEAGDAGKKEINFAHHANELFKNGNYYTGDYQGAFSYYIRAQKATILYFGPSSYSGAFTFIHEFGHYYESIYNAGASLSYDLEETHSQGNEMLFLAYLSNYLEDKNCQPAFLSLVYDNIFNMVGNILIATAVDEFEQIAYSNSYDGTNVEISRLLTDGQIDATEYDKLFELLAKDYGFSEIYATYNWRYIVIESAGYYISYAMSALPSLELFVKGLENFEEAKQSYFKLFTFTENEDFAQVDEYGDLVVTAGYADTLHYAGLDSPFDIDLYTTLKGYFQSLLG